MWAVRLRTFRLWVCYKHAIWRTSYNVTGIRHCVLFQAVQIDIREKGVLQRFLCRNPILWIVLEDLVQQIHHLFRCTTTHFSFSALLSQFRCESPRRQFPREDFIRFAVVAENRIKSLARAEILQIAPGSYC